MEGKLIIFSAPSGAGKTSIVREVINTIPGLAFSVSACSRPMRTGEVEGADYYFLSTADFKQKIKEDAFLEWEEVYPGSYYGTLKSEVHRLWKEGKQVVFDVDVAGGLRIKQQFPAQSLALFIKPPSLEILKQRLENRGTESKESLEKRLGKAAHELSFANRFDKVVVNDSLPLAVREVTSLVKQFLH